MDIQRQLTELADRLNYPVNRDNVELAEQGLSRAEIKITRFREIYGLGVTPTVWDNTLAGPRQQAMKAEYLVQARLYAETHNLTITGRSKSRSDMAFANAFNIPTSGEPCDTTQHKVLRDMLRNLQQAVAGDDKETAAGENRCIMRPLGCGRPLSATVDHSRCLEGQYFYNEVSQREYGITGMCQDCQDQFAAQGERLGCEDDDGRPVHPDCADPDGQCGCGRG